MSNVRYIPLTKGMVAKVDARDWSLLSQFRWKLTKDGYAARNLTERGRTSITVLMHRFIVGPFPSEQIDHINGDRLDNRRRNLRICTAAENTRNRRKLQWKRWKGVVVRRDRKNVYARIGGRHLGVFANEHEAARAYDRAAIELYGEFAHLNFPATLSE